MGYIFMTTIHPFNVLLPPREMQSVLQSVARHLNAHETLAESDPGTAAERLSYLTCSPAETLAEGATAKLSEKLGGLPVASDGMAYLDIESERGLFKFRPSDLTDWIYGSHEQTERLREAASALSSDKTVGPLAGWSSKKYDMSRDYERRATAHAAKSVIRMLQADLSRGDEIAARAKMSVLALAYPGAHSRLSTHMDLFVPAIRSLASVGQRKAWLPKALSFAYMGAFALTELSHGSYSRGVLTTVTVRPPTGDRTKPTLVLHSPCIEAAKIWIGAAASTSTHAVVFAQLEDAEGTKCGMQAVLVQLRDPLSGKVLPGRRILDTGAKHGRNGLDNGILLFDGVELEPEALLGRYVSLDEAGRATTSQLSQIAFAAIVEGRILMVSGSGYCAAAALTVAGRYASWRRQFPPRKQSTETTAVAEGKGSRAAGGGGGEAPSSAATIALQSEVRLIEYPVTKMRLLPIAGLAFACRSAFLHLKGIHGQIYERLSALETKMSGEGGAGGPVDLLTAAGGMEGVMQLRGLLKKMHVLSSSAKALSTWSAHDAIEECRRQLGGLGYMSYTGLSSLANDFAVMCSWEGDNHVMMLQCGRALAKQDAAFAADLLPELPARYSSARGGSAVSRDSKATALLAAGAHRLAQTFEAQLRLATAASSLARRSEAGPQVQDPAAPSAVELATTFSCLYFVRCCLAHLEASTEELPAAGVLAVKRSLCAWMLSIAPGRGVAGLPRLEHWNGIADAEHRGEVLALAEAWEFSDWSLSTCVGRSRPGGVAEVLARVCEAPENKRVLATRPDGPASGGGRKLAMGQARGVGASTPAVIRGEIKRGRDVEAKVALAMGLY